MWHFFINQRTLRKLFCVTISIYLCFGLIINGNIELYAAEEKPNLQLNALSACLIDAESGRVLYGKNETEIRAMASTTKIMTLIIALEKADLNDIVTISKNAARQPDVQLNVNTGEEYVLNDLLYSLMLESHNDVAVAIAEHIGGSVEGFADLMNEKARELGLNNTYFITPNGLDAEDEKGKHSTTAVDLAHLAAYAIKNETFLEITNTQSHSFQEVNGKRSFNVYNKNQFLSMMEGAIGVKTGFTADAGYCFVGALKQDGRTFVSVVLGSGWPPNKTYKWTDTRKMMGFGAENYFPATIYDEEFYEKVCVSGGTESEVEIGAGGTVSALLSKYDDVKVYYQYDDDLEAPVENDYKIGEITVVINNVVVEVIPIKTKGEVKKIDFAYFVKKITKEFVEFNFIN